MSLSAEPRRCCCLLFVLLAAALCKASDVPTTQSCHGDPVPAAAKGVSPNPHPIKLTWQASVPTSPAKPNAVAGYMISRHEGGKRCDQSGNSCVTLNPSLLIHGTSCIDFQVQSGHTYTYQARAVSASKKVSDYSKEATATAQ